jgi:L-ascorbate metabolism protein UlaG (beta-lactamase superfamily)
VEFSLDFGDRDHDGLLDDWEVAEEIDPGDGVRRAARRRPDTPCREEDPRLTVERARRGEGRIDLLRRDGEHPVSTRVLLPRSAPYTEGPRRRHRPMRIRHFLYNAFLIEAPGRKIAIDPGQNLWLFGLRSLIPEAEWPSVTHLVITHGDPDHHWQSDRLAAASGAHVICGEELTRRVDGEIRVIDPRGRGLASWVPFPNLHPLALGDSVTLDGVRFEAIRSVHGPIEISILGFKLRRSPGPGERVGLGSMGFEITIGDRTLVNLGDSLLLPNWGRLEPDVLMLPIGGLGNDTWTMDVDDAIEAVKRISPRLVIPCHYSLPFLWWKRFAVADDQHFRREVEKLDVECCVLGEGEELVL